MPDRVTVHQGLGNGFEVSFECWSPSVPQPTRLATPFDHKEHNDATNIELLFPADMLVLLRARGQRGFTSWRGDRRCDAV